MAKVKKVNSALTYHLPFGNLTFGGMQQHHFSLRSSFKTRAGSREPSATPASGPAVATTSSCPSGRTCSRNSRSLSRKQTTGNRKAGEPRSGRPRSPILRSRSSRCRPHPTPSRCRSRKTILLRRRRDGRRMNKLDRFSVQNILILV